MSFPSQNGLPVFAIVISEKGGAERREVFDRAEISVGRVQGNDLMLPKGNVSKRHARLLVRDERFIVTDLNSTNGTYVNRRRISQATIVRRGDRIYIGDFVLRIEEPRLGDSSSTGRSGASRPMAESAAEIPSVPAPPRVPTGAQNVYGTLAPSSPDSAGDEASPAIAVYEGDEPPSRVFDEATLTLQAALVSRVAAAIGPDTLFAEISPETERNILRLLDEQGRALAEEDGGHVPDDAKQGASSELLELGPLTQLLKDSSVMDIAVPRYSRVVVSGDERTQETGIPFSCEPALKWAIARLCRMAGTSRHDGESILRRQLPDGTSVWAVQGSRSLSGAAVVLHKPRLKVRSLDDFVRAGTLSRAMATFLERCAAGRVNMLVLGHARDTVSGLAGALVTAAGADEPVVVLQGDEEIPVDSSSALRLSIGGLDQETGEAMRMATSIPEARVAIELADPQVCNVAVGAIGAGASGVVGVLRASGSRQGLGQLVASVLATRPGAAADAAREWIASSFEVLIEVGRLRDGRYRVLRIAEIAGISRDEIQTQEVFSFVVERTASGGAVEGSFYPSGSVPRIVEEMTARGILVDSSVFRRPALR